ncbi:ATP-binding protein [Streptomyces sp. NPDC050982]|uniref:ATP-binding protein n=1 Tax=Streptomyces sp. NPDC050982 TaxID=3154746 RepID=UPI0033E632D7
MATVSPSWAYTLQLPHDPRAPGIARATLRTVLVAHDLARLAPTAELLAAELLANAHLHTNGPYALRLRAAESGRLRIGVWDSDPTVPRVRRPRCRTAGHVGERARAAPRAGVCGHVGRVRTGRRPGREAALGGVSV